ncbi:MAG TPA: hypothetical protein ENN67_07370 [Firmicutes bacterium]|nr:hypothetical protein [Bacillota bacterium]
MDFEHLEMQYAGLREQWKSGRITQEQFYNSVQNLRLRDPAGMWWQIEPSTGNWLTWNGAQWIKTTRPGQPPAPSVYQTPPSPSV